MISDNHIINQITKSGCVVSIFLHQNRIIMSSKGLANTRVMPINKPQPFCWMPRVNVPLAI